MRLRYTSRALAEIEQLQDYIAERNPAAALATAERIRKKLSGLTAHPSMGRSGRVAGTRELVIAGTPYLVAYRVEAKAVVILAVIHGAQRWPDEL
jgi:addiction module RelE/StbE family toxin